jgi:hypothetical protein
LFPSDDDVFTFIAPWGLLALWLAWVFADRTPLLDQSRLLAIRNGGLSMDDTDPMLQFFAFAHLRDDLQVVSRPFGDLADWLAQTLPRNPERTVALRKLLEAKDCAVRAKLYIPTPP